MLRALFLTFLISLSINSFAGDYGWVKKSIEAFQDTHFINTDELTHDASQLLSLMEDKYGEAADGHAFYRSGVYQEYMLSVFIKLFNGYPFNKELQTGFDYTTNSGADGNSAGLLEIFLNRRREAAQSAEPTFDAKGLQMLKSYILAFEGVDRSYLDFQQRILGALDGIQPDPQDFTDYEYRSVNEPEYTVFKYDRFNYDEAKEAIVEAADLLEKNIRNFPEEMQKHLKGNIEQIERVHALLKEQHVNPDTRINITLLGTSGNGKTEFAKTLAKVKYGSLDDMFKFTFTGKFNEVDSLLGSAKGVKGSDEPPEFIRWIMEQKEKNKGGVIILDELLSFHGLTEEQTSKKVEALNQLYDLLDERQINVTGEIIDISEFDVVITGNAFQDVFNGLDDNPDVEKNVERIIRQLERKDIVDYLTKYGFDPPKIARLGEIFINGPLPRAQVQEIGELLLEKNLQTVRKVSEIDIVVDKGIVEGITSRLTTIQLGMREVNTGLSHLVRSAVNGILFDLKDEEIKKIEGKLDGETIKWYVNGEEVVLDSEVINESSGLKQSTWKRASEASNSSSIVTPQFKHLDIPNKPRVEELERVITAIHEVKGHWMVDALLNGGNQSSAINITPSGQSLGYVMPKLDREFDVYASSLTTIMKRIFMLEAGHRAPITEGFYATGGGSTNREPGKPPRDDLAKIDKNLDAIMNNHLFKEYHEHSDEKTVKRFRETMRDLGKEVTDAIINFGNDNNFADQIMDDILSQEYLQEDYLDEYVTKRMDRLKDYDLIFLDSINEGLSNLLERYKKLDKAELAIRTQMLSTLVEAVYSDTAAARRYKNVVPGLDEELDRAKRKSQTLMKKYNNATKSGCMGILSRIFRG